MTGFLSSSGPFAAVDVSCLPDDYPALFPRLFHTVPSREAFLANGSYRTSHWKEIFLTLPLAPCSHLPHACGQSACLPVLATWTRSKQFSISLLHQQFSLFISPISQHIVCVLISKWIPLILVCFTDHLNASTSWTNKRKSFPWDLLLSPRLYIWQKELKAVIWDCVGGSGRWPTVAGGCCSNPRGTASGEWGVGREVGRAINPQASALVTKSLPRKDSRTF